MSENLLYNEQELFLRITEGDEQAFRMLFNTHSDFLLSYIFQLTRNREMAEEIVQDIFVKIWQTRGNLLKVRDFKSYLFIIARNHALNALKKMAREKRKQSDWECSRSSAEMETDGDVIYLDLIDEAVKQLPSQQQLVWIMSRRKGKKYSEISETLNLSRETVKKYLQYATASIIKHVSEKLNLILLLMLFIPRKYF